MAALNDRFWAKVLFKEYIRHYRKFTDEQIVADVRQSMDDLEDLVDTSASFGSKMVRWSMERANEPFATAARENGKKGGRPRKNQETTADGDTREDSHDEKSGTSANNSATTSCTDKSADKGRTDGHSLRVGNVARPPVRSSGPEKRPFGDNGNVRLTIDQGKKLRESYGEDLLVAIGILDSYIQNLPVKAEGHRKNGSKFWKEEYLEKDHYAVMREGGWVWNRVQETRTANAKRANAEKGYRNTAEKNEDVIRELAEYYADKDEGRTETKFNILELAK